MWYFGATVYSRYFLWNHHSYWALTQWEEMAAALLLRLSCLNVNDHSPGLIQVVSRTHCSGGLCLDTWPWYFRFKPDMEISIHSYLFFKKKKKKKTFYFWVISAHPQFQRIWTVFCMLRFNVFLSWLVGSKRKISFKKDSWIRHQISQRNRREIKEECLCSQEGRPQIWVSFSLFFSSLDRYCFCSFTFW